MSDQSMSQLPNLTLAEALAVLGKLAGFYDGHNFTINVAELAAAANSVYQPHASTPVKGVLTITQGRYTTHYKVSVGDSGEIAALVPIPSSGLTGKVLKVLDSDGEIGWGDADGCGANDKVAVDSTTTAGYLEDVLKSEDDNLITITKVNGQLRIGLNLSGESDPKLSTMPESLINGSTSNYGAYALQEGAEKLVWGDASFESFSYCNALVYQSTRISEAQGAITKCNVAICGSISLENPPACLNIGIFDTEGNLLGQTGLKFYGTDFTSGQELCSFDMQETIQGSLNLKRNTRYIIQAWTCGLQLAALDRSSSSATTNYVYDYAMRQNLQCSVSNVVSFVHPNTTSMTQGTVIPFITFGAADLS